MDDGAVDGARLPPLQGRRLEGGPHRPPLHLRQQAGPLAAGVEGRDEEAGVGVPDEGDALAVTFANPVVPRPRDALGELAPSGGKALTKYDPFERRS